MLNIFHGGNWQWRLLLQCHYLSTHHSEIKMIFLHLKRVNESLLDLRVRWFPNVGAIGALLLMQRDESIQRGRNYLML